MFVRETRGHAELEAAARHDRRTTTTDAALTNRQIFLRTSFTEPALSSASQAGLVNNLNFGLSWGLFPILFATTGMPVDRIGMLVAALPRGVGRRATGHRRTVGPVGPQASDHRRACSPKPPRWR